MTYAAFNGFITCVEFLHKCGAKLSVQDKLKRTPLHWACRYNQQDVAHVLLRLGADLEGPDFEGKRPVDIALENDFKEMVKAVTKHIQFANKRRAAGLSK